MELKESKIKNDNRIWMHATATLFIIMVIFAYELLSASDDTPKPTTILTWWGYLSDQEKLSEIEAACHTKIEITEFLNVDELKDLASKSPYEIYIYPWGYHMDIENYLPSAGPKINDVVRDYHPKILEQYNISGIADDSVFFQHAVRMFIYDKTLIPEINALTPEGIIELSNQGKVVLLDDLKPLNWIIKQFSSGTTEENWLSVYSLIKSQLSKNNPKKGLFFSSFAPDYLDQDIALGMLNSGEVFNPSIGWSSIAKPGSEMSLGFGVHHQLSQSSSDVLALKSQTPESFCVAKKMASRSFLKWISETSYYFSPFEESIDSLPKHFQHLTQEFYEQADQIVWLDDLLFDEPPSDQAKLIWQIIKACRVVDEKCEESIKIGEEKLF